MIRTLLIAACLMVSGAAMAETLPVPSDPHVSNWAERGSGRVSVNFQTIMCIKAPCPPGYFLISVDGGPGEMARSIELEDRSVTPAIVKPFDGRSFPSEFEDATLVQDGTAFRIIIGD